MGGRSSSFLGWMQSRLTRKRRNRLFDLSSSDSDDEKSKIPEPSSIPSSIKRFFGLEKPGYSLFGGGKCNQEILIDALFTTSVILNLFECLGYHLGTFICNAVIFGATILFVFSKATAYINKQRVEIPAISFSEDLFHDVASAVCFEINRLFAVIHDVASGRDLKKYLLHLFLHT